MTVVFGGLTPHHPGLIPDIGGPDAAAHGRTVAAMRELARQVVSQGPDVVVIVTPHGRSTGESFSVCGGEWHTGALDRPTARRLVLDSPGDPMVAAAIRDFAEAADLSVRLSDRRDDTPLDHGVSVPLYYLQAAGYAGPVVPLTVSGGSREHLRRLGRAVAQAVSALGKSTVLLASGDLSHHHDAADGARFDDTLVKLLGAGDWDRLFKLDPALRRQADECGYQALLVLMGALEKSLPRAELLAYEGPKGVGYATAAIQVDDPGAQDDAFNPAGFARQVVDTFLQTGRLPEVPLGFPKKAQGCFVCLKRDGEFAVCAGSATPTEATLAQEVARHALTAIQRYAERHEAAIDEVIHHVGFSVDLVSDLAPLDGPEGLDPERHGVVAIAGDRQGVALPRTAQGADAASMIAAALQHGGFAPDDRPTLRSFRVERHAELFRPAW